MLLQLTFPICQAGEHDSVLLYCSRDDDAPYADPPATGVVNASIDLFSVAIPLHAPKVQESSVEQIATFLSSPSLQRNPGRKAAMVVNVAVALLHALKVAVKEAGSAAGRLNPATDKILQELLQVSSMNSLAARVMWLTLPRNLSPTLIQLFGRLELRRLDDYATILETP